MSLVATKNVKQTMILVTVEQDASPPNLWRVHVRKGPGVKYPQAHAEMLPSEAENLHIELGNAIADARRKNVRKNL